MLFALSQKLEIVQYDLQYDRFTEISILYAILHEMFTITLNA